MKTLLVCTITALLSLQAIAEETAASIEKKHMAAMLKDLQAYAKANPDADDYLPALDLAMSTAYQMEDLDTVLVLAKELYTHTLKQKDSPTFDQSIAGAVQVYVQISIAKGDREGAMKFLEKAIADVKEIGAAGPNLAGVFEQSAGMLMRPVKGDTLAIAGKTVADKDFDLKNLKGKWVVVKFWATWCGPCLNEMPAFFKMSDDYHGDKFEIVAISLDRSEVPLNAYIESNKMPWVHLMDGAQAESIADKYGINSIPANFLISPEGKVVAANAQPNEIAGILEEKLAAKEDK